MKICTKIVLILALLAAQAALAKPLDAVLIDGNRVVSDKALVTSYQPYIGQQISSQLQDELVQSVQQKYLSQGWLKPWVEIAVNRSVPSVLELHITEPVVSAFDPIDIPSKQHQALRLAINSLFAGQVLSLDLINRCPEYIAKRINRKVDCKIEPEKHQPGYILAVKSLISSYAELQISNSGAKSLGRNIAELYTGIRYRETKLDVEAVSSLGNTGYQGLDLSIQQSVIENWFLHMEWGASEASPIEPVAARTESYQRDSYGLGVSYKTQSKQRQGSRYLVSVSARDFTADNQAERLYTERLRYAKLQYRGWHSGQRVSQWWQLEWEQGLDSIGAASQGVDGQLLPDLDYSLQRLNYVASSGWHNWGGRMDVQGQYSDSRVPYSQQLALGGDSLINAYEPGEFSGDSGLLAQLEINYGWQWTKRYLFQPYLFYGLGKTWFNQEQSESAAAAGIGVRYRQPYLSCGLELGKPLTTETEYSTDGERLRAFVNIRL